MIVCGAEKIKNGSVAFNMSSFPSVSDTVVAISELI